MKTERLFMRSLICAPLTVILQLLCIFYYTYLCLVEEGEKWLSNEEINILHIYGRKHIFSCVHVSCLLETGGYLMDVSVCLISALLMEDFEYLALS